MANKEARESCQVHIQPDSSQTVSSRRLKKREVDRRCQRESRERKKSHIAYLESLVEHLKRQDTSGQVASLLKQLKKTEEERDAATKTLRDIQQLIQRPPNPGEVSIKDAGTLHAKSNSDHVAGTCEIASSTEMCPPVPNGIEATSLSTSDPNYFGSLRNSTLDLHNIPYPEVVNQSRPGVTDWNFAQSTKTPKHKTKASSPRAYGWINPQSSCCCSALVDRQSGQPAVWQGNFWKFVVDVMSERFDWTEDVQPATDTDSEDVPIRAILEGWDVVAERTPLHPSWQMLRRIDEALFGPIPKTERLAMLRAMHLLLQYHTDPSTERYKRLPPWYIYRPSQDIPHTYAIDYYAWPHFRQRFILNEHAYCGNGFFRMYQYEMRLMWPFEFRDCYTHDLETGLYKPSRLFDERINDINCWTMGPDFFNRFPELSGAIPGAIRQIPKSLSCPTDWIERRLLQQDATTSDKDMPITSDIAGEGEEQERLDQELGAEMIHGDWTGVLPVDDHPHSRQWHSGQAFILPGTTEDSYLGQPALDPTLSFSSSGGFNPCNFDFNLS